jgi:hypothetical protein
MIQSVQRKIERHKNTAQRRISTLSYKVLSD